MTGRRVAARCAGRARREEGARVGMRGPGEEVVAPSPTSSKLSAIHDADPVADLRDDAEVVGDQKHGGAVPVPERIDEPQHLRLDGDVERGRRLVGDQELRVVGERRGNDDPLPHAAGEPVRRIVIAARRPQGCRPRSSARSRGPWPRGRPIFWCARRVSAICVADGPGRIEAGGGVLEDHRRLVAAHACAARPRRGR